MEKQQIYTTNTATEQKEKTQRDRRIVQNGLEFADDTQLFIEKTHTNKCVKG